MPTTALIDALHAVRRRATVLSAAYGAGRALAVGVGLVVGVAVVDYLLDLPPAPRLVAVLGLLAAVGVVVARWVVRPLRHAPSLGDVAGRVETTFPQFDDRLRSTVNILGGTVPGSEPMKRRIVSETTALAGGLDLGRAVVAAPAYHAAAMGFGTLLLAAAVGLAVPDYARAAMARLANPFGTAVYPKRVRIELVGTTAAKVPLGARLDVTMRLAKGDRGAARPTRAILHYRLDDGTEQLVEMARGPGGVYAAAVDARLENPAAASGTLAAWITAGDDTRAVPPVTVLPRLAVARVDAEITPPKYVTGDAARPTIVNLAQQPAVTGAGSTIRLVAGFNKPLAADPPARLVPAAPEAKVPAAAFSATGATAAATWTADESVRFRLNATDTDGFTNPGLEEYEVIVRPDQNPTVQIERPRGNEERTAVATVPLQAVAEDDYGVASLQLLVAKLGTQQAWTIDLVKDAKPADGVAWTKPDGTGGRQRFRAEYAWDLGKSPAAAALKPGDVLEYSLLARDNFDLAGKRHDAVPSGKLRVTIISQEQLADAITNELRQVAAQVADVKNTQTRTAGETAALAKETAGKREFDPADRGAGERLAGQQGAAAAQAKQIGGKLDAVRTRLDENKSPAKDLGDLARNVQDILNRASEGPMKDAAADVAKAAAQKAAPNATAAQQKQETDARNDALDKAGGEQKRAGEQLSDALDKLGNIGSLQTTIDKINGLLTRQRELTARAGEAGRTAAGQKPEDLKPDDKARVDALAADQQKLADATEKALAEMDKTGKQLAKSDPASAEAMTKAAQTGQQQQVSPNQSKAAQQSKQNQQSQAQASQKQAELGLEMILNELKDAEKRKLEELNRKLAQLQQQVANLVRRQAGHNLDDLGLQGPDARAARLDEKSLAEVLAYAERTKGQEPPLPTHPQLTAGQEQTERNARDVAKDAERTSPEAAAPAAALTRAASKMERAIVSLREKDLGKAYDPSQVDALAALLEAKAAVDKQKADAEKKQEDQQKEAIRAHYERVKKEQEAVNAETVRVDKNPRDPQGNYTRADALGLRKLTDQQDKLAADADTIKKDLESVGGVVYVWANDDIVAAMRGVRDRLNTPLTGVPTRAEQQRIVDQLDAMIRNLAVKPPEPDKFANRNQGGGGGGGAGQPQVKLPAEAEIKLLKDFQLALNKSTKAIDADPHPRDAKADQTKPLGNRQGTLRDLLGKLLGKSTGGKVKLGPEPDNKDQLPEEAAAEDVDDQELVDLLKGDPDAERVSKDMNLVGDRMARSRQRLAENNDAGKVTQKIQERIILDLQQLQDAARKQEQQQASAKPGNGPPKPGEQQQNKPGQAQAQNQGAPKPGQQQPGGQAPAADSSPAGGGEAPHDLSAQLKESQSEWGKISPRARDAVVEGASEQPLQKYKKLIDDYYRGVALQGPEK